MQIIIIIKQLEVSNRTCPFLQNIPIYLQCIYKKKDLIKLEFCDKYDALTNIATPFIKKIILYQTKRQKFHFVSCKLRSIILKRNTHKYTSNLHYNYFDNDIYRGVLYNVGYANYFLSVKMHLNLFLCEMQRFDKCVVKLCILVIALKFVFLYESDLIKNFQCQ